MCRMQKFSNLAGGLFKCVDKWSLVIDLLPAQGCMEHLCGEEGPSHGCRDQYAHVNEIISVISTDWAEDMNGVCTQQC